MADPPDKMHYTKYFLHHQASVLKCRITVKPGLPTFLPVLSALLPVDTAFLSRKTHFDLPGNPGYYKLGGASPRMIGGFFYYSSENYLIH
jgi:hypothetical protein